MRTLFVLRHAKAERDSASGRDFDRPLADRGRRDAASVGREMRARSLQPDAVLASPATRVRETVESVQTEFRFKCEITLEPRIYEGTARTLIELVQEIPDACATALLAGHNPGLQELVLALADYDQAGMRDEVKTKFPTAALVVVDLPVQRWREVKPGSGGVVALITPRTLSD